MLRAFLLVIAMLFLLLPVAVAGGEEGEPASPIIDLGPISDALEGLQDAVAGVGEGVAGVPGAVADELFGRLRYSMAEFAGGIVGFLKPLLVENIDPESFYPHWQLVAYLLSLFYLLLFMWVGAKFLFGSYDAGQRAQAKEWLKNVVILVIAVQLSLFLYAILLGLSGAITGYLWASELEALFVFDNLPGLNMAWLLFLVLAAFLAFIVLLLRQVVLVAGVMLFPIGVFLYFIPPLKPFGSAIINLLGATAFLQVVNVVLLIAVNLTAQEFAVSPAIGIGVNALGLLLIVLFDNLIFAFVLLKGLFSSAFETPEIRVIGRPITGGVV